MLVLWASLKISLEKRIFPPFIFVITLFINVVGDYFLAFGFVGYLIFLILYIFSSLIGSSIFRF